MTSSHLDIEVRLLVVKYGFEKVLTALAQAGNTNIEDLRSMLQELERRPKSSQKKRPQQTAEQIVNKLDVDGPEKGELLKTLAHRFDSRVFLPNLRDVRLFLQEHGNEGVPKARHRAAEPLFRYLADLPLSELRGMVSVEGSQQSSWYSDLSAQIIGDVRQEPTAVRESPHNETD